MRRGCVLAYEGQGSHKRGRARHLHSPTLTHLLVHAHTDWRLGVLQACPRVFVAHTRIIIMRVCGRMPLSPLWASALHTYICMLYAAAQAWPRCVASSCVASASSRGLSVATVSTLRQRMHSTATATLEERTCERLEEREEARRERSRGEREEARARAASLLEACDNIAPAPCRKDKANGCKTRTSGECVQHAAVLAAARG